MSTANISTRTIKPKAKDFYTDQGLHSAMQQWASLQNKPSLCVEVQFKDGSKYNDEFQRETKEVQYKTQDGEIYTVEVHSGKFKETWFSNGSLSVKELKQGFVDWLYEGNNPDAIVSIKWGKV